MGRKSTKENKSIYQVMREELDLTREKAADMIPGFSPERIEKIENGRIQVQPDDVMLMAEYYKQPSLCNYYCSQECPIGQKHVPKLESKELVQITVETLNALNQLQKDKDRLLEISEDGQIRPDEVEDFIPIMETLDKIMVSVSTLRLWLEEKCAQGKMDKELFDL